MSAQLPDELHRLRGTRPTRAAAQGSSVPGGKPKMPKTLGSVAAAKWREMLRILSDRGTLTRGDGPALELYCQTWARWCACLKEIDEHGVMVEATVTDSSGESFTKRVLNPASKLAAQLEVSLRQMLKEFSATPASREKAKRAAPDPAKQPKVKPGEDPDPIML